MEYWYCVIRERFGKVRAKRVSCQSAPTQADLLVLMNFDPKYETVLELEKGSSFEHGQFLAYVEMMYQNQSDIKITLTELEQLVGK